MIGDIVFFTVSLLLSGVTWYLYSIIRASGLHERRMTGFGVLCITVPFWILLNAVSYIIPPEYFAAIYILKAFPLNIIPYMSCLFFLHFSESGAAGSRFVKYFSVIMPALAILLLVTNPLHNTYYLEFSNPPKVGYSFLAHLTVSALYMFIVYITLFRYVIAHFRSSLLMAAGGVGAIIPVVFYAVYLFLPDALPYDFTPIGYFLTILFIVYASYHSRIKRTRPGILGDTLAKIANSEQVTSGDIYEAARLISLEACLALDVYRVRVWDYDGPTQTLKNIACYNNAEGSFKAQEDYNMQGIPGFAEYLMSERIIAINDTGKALAELGIPYDPEVCAVLFAPVRVGSNPVGLVCIEQNYSKDFITSREWNPQEQAFVSSLADLMVLAITNAERQSLITRLEEEQAALRESEENVQTLLDSAPFSVNLIDSDFNCAFVNEEAVRLYGLRSKQEYMDLFATGKLSEEKGIDHIKKAYSEGYSNCEMVFRSPNGELLPCELTMVRVKYKGDYAIAAYARDLRKERAAAEKLTETESARRNLQAILDMLPVGIRILSIDNLTLLYSNKACLNLFGCSSFEEQVRHQSGFAFMPEFQPDGRRTEDAVNEIFQRGWPVAEIQCLRLNGEPFLCRVTSCTIKYGGHLASLAAMEDITEEHNRRKMLESIAHKEQEANQLKSRFLATMSHEIRTPMNAVIGMTEIALRETDTETKNEYIRTARQAATALLAIVNDILDFSKIEAGKLEIVPKDYSVTALLNDVVSIIKTKADGLKIRFAIKADSRIPHTLFGDEVKIRQAILNVLSNAVKFTEEGNVVFSIYADFKEDGTVNLIFEVTDTGIGIKPEDMERLFSGFIQFDIEKNRGTEGTGLGLAITHSIIKAMGGEISVKSEYGKGSTFTIMVPQKYQSREALAKVNRPEDKCVLIYERRAAFAESMEYTLGNLGVKCSLAGDRAELCGKLESGEYNYLFVPTVLLDEIEDITAKYENEAKLILITGYSGETHYDYKNTIAMPAYCVQVADMFNEAYSNVTYLPDDSPPVPFAAPEAKILIVDDIGTNLAVAQGLLAPYNVQVDLCKSGAQAIDAVRDGQYDLVFMDHKMPKMDGVEATQHIREMGEKHPHCKELPIIALTANAVSGVMEMFLENGFNDFLTKPIDTAKLNAVLEKWIPDDKKIRS